MEDHTLSQPQQTACDEQLKECQNQVTEWKDRFLRNAADFENFKKRTEKEKMLWMSTAQSSVLNDLVAIVDDFDRAFSPLRLSGSPDLASFGGQASPADQSLVGFELIYKELHKLLEKYGVTEIKELTQFDPALHEAIMHVEAPEKQSGDIVQVLQKGYMFKGQVLRPAKVSVAKESATSNNSAHQ